MVAINGCSSNSSLAVPISSGGTTANFQTWDYTSSPLAWGASLNSGAYGEGSTVPYRIVIPQQCSGSSWSVTVQYDFEHNNGSHLYDFLTTYNASECTVAGNECAPSYNCGP